MNCALLHEYCIGCKKTRITEHEGPIDEITGKPSYKAGDFVVPCNGINGEGKFVPNYDKIATKISAEQLKTAQEIYDPIAWAEKNLKWKPRKGRNDVEYQTLALRCTSKRKVFRWGRRLGKTDVLAIKALHFLFTNSPKAQRWDANRGEWVNGFGNILVLTPFLSQVKNLFNRMHELIDMNPDLKAEIVRSISTPYHLIELRSGTRIVGFSAGAKGAESVRGQKADLVILDEMDYLDEGSIENIVALIMEHADVELVCASTPTGRREYFYKFCKERMDFKEFHFTSMFNPSWGPAMEAELRQFYNTEAGWQHEILAEFGEATTSVFQHAYVTQARSEYRYDQMSKELGWTYAIGVDWNDVANGTKIVVTGWNNQNGYFKVVAKETVQKIGWTQTMAIQKIIELNRAWAPEYIYVDAGYGAMQVEVLRKFGMDAKYGSELHSKVDANLANVVGINFSSKVEVHDPITGLPINKPMKPYLVENSVRRFEQGLIKISIYDEMLYRQLIGYQIAKVNASGLPVYEAGPDGDHDLDALMISLLAFQMETSEFINPTYNGMISFSGSFGQSNAGDAPKSIGEMLAKIDSPTKSLAPSVPTPRNQSVSSGQVSGFGKRIYTESEFNNDDRSRRSEVKRNESFLRRGGARTGRKSF